MRPERCWGVNRNRPRTGGHIGNRQGWDLPGVNVTDCIVTPFCRTPHTKRPPVAFANATAAAAARRPAGHVLAGHNRHSITLSIATTPAHGSPADQPLAITAPPRQPTCSPPPPSPPCRRSSCSYNREGDLLFSSAKDGSPSVWFSHNGERIGSYDGHNGTVWCIDVRYDTTLLISGSADNSCSKKQSERLPTRHHPVPPLPQRPQRPKARKLHPCYPVGSPCPASIPPNPPPPLAAPVLWDVKSGDVISQIETKSAVRSCGFSYSGKSFFFSTDKAMGQLSELRIFSLADVNKPGGSAAQPYLTIPSHDSKVTAAIWGPLDETIITGHDNGDICKWDAKTGDMLKKDRHHRAKIEDIQMYPDQSVFMTACRDQHAMIFNADDMEVLKDFKTERPVNSAAMSPLRDHVVLGGGQDAMSVTTTSAKVGKFDAAFYHKIYGDEIGRVKGHFGPINSLQFNPNGRQYCSGGEDGYIRMHNFDDSYFEYVPPLPLPIHGGTVPQFLCRREACDAF